MLIEIIIYTKNYSINHYIYAENCYMITCNRNLIKWLRTAIL